MQEFIERALKEDVGNGDHTTLACLEPDQQAKAQLIFKGDGIASGLEESIKIFHHIDQGLVVDTQIKDGDSVTMGDVGFVVSGRGRSILTGERLVLNLMQRMSGIATTTNEYVRLIQHTKAKVLDTRKTTPNLRSFEKKAVRIGGGMNHRFGLYDMIMIKDNHVDAAGGIKQALHNTRRYLDEKHLDLKVEIEVRSMEEFNQVMQVGGADRIMLDNFSVELTKEAVNANKGVELESSGGITKETITGYAEAGVDFISVGALTHSVSSLDISLKIQL